MKEDSARHDSGALRRLERVHRDVALGLAARTEHGDLAVASELSGDHSHSAAIPLITTCCPGTQVSRVKDLLGRRAGDRDHGGDREAQLVAAWRCTRTPAVPRARRRCRGRVRPCP
jgi:hypothetical protein